MFGFFFASDRNTTDFHMLLLFSAALLNLFSSSNCSFFHRFLKIFCIKYISGNKDSFTSFFPFFGCILFLCLFLLPWLELPVLNKSGGRRYTCLVPDLSGKTLSISLLSMILAFGFFIHSLDQIKDTFF